MNTFELEIFDDEGSVCTFYTVKLEGASLSETEKFFRKFQKDERLKGPLGELAKFIEVRIGEEYGAIDEYFRKENEAQAIPPSGKYEVEEATLNYSNFPLRLYCLRINENLVILFNGAEKSAQSAQDGKTSMVFYEANAFAKRIKEALSDGTIYVTESGRELKYYNKGSEIIL